MLAVVLANAVLIYAALATFPGVTVERAYERGRGYNQVLAEAARQDALGWRAELALGEDRRLTLLAFDRAGRPLEAQVASLLERPLEGTELPLAFAAAGPGRWVAAVPGEARAGQWDARLTLTGQAGERLELRRRIFLP
uniref:FixH family protein n=1 Tax=Caldovatus aquaticus TaxID=2865671 RepID=UPI001C66817F